MKYTKLKGLLREARTEWKACFLSLVDFFSFQKRGSTEAEKHRRDAVRKRLHEHFGTPPLYGRKGEPTAPGNPEDRKPGGAA